MCEMTQKINITCDIIVLYEFMNRFWVAITYCTFEMQKTLHHSPYHMIMDSLYLLKCLVE